MPEGPELVYVDHGQPLTNLLDLVEPDKRQFVELFIEELQQWPTLWDLIGEKYPYPWIISFAESFADRVQSHGR